MLGPIGPRRPSTPVTRLPPNMPHPYMYAAPRVRPRTFTVAVYILGAVLLLQVVMVISVFWLRAAIVPVNFLRPKARPVAPVAATAAPVVSPADMPNLAVSSRRTLLALPTASDAQTQIANVMDRAAQMREHAAQPESDEARRNDLHEALNIMLQAEDIDPRNPDALKGIAEVYDLLDDPAHSRMYWQRLVDLGPAVGHAYSLASDHVQLLKPAPGADALQAPSTLSRAIYIDDVVKTPIQTGTGAPQFQLRTVLTRKDPAMPDFDQKKLQPYVIFYQKVNDGSPGGTLVPDLRPHKGGFENTFLFWNKTLKEAFNVEYTLPVAGSAGPDGKPMGEYYGFVIGIYYDKTLQDARSEPADLITRLPLPDGIE
jgi:hypothetical protein